MLRKIQTWQVRNRCPRLHRFCTGTSAHALWLAASTQSSVQQASPDVSLWLAAQHSQALITLLACCLNTVKPQPHSLLAASTQTSLHQASPDLQGLDPQRSYQLSSCPSPQAASTLREVQPYFSHCFHTS